MKKENLSSFLKTFAQSIENDDVEFYKRIIESSEIKSFDNVEEFFYAVQYPFERFISGFIKETISNDRDVKFIYENYQFLERNFRNLIEKKEGVACCADKSRTIVNSILNFYTNRSEILFNYDQEYTYHLPKTIFNNHTDIINFYQGLKSLYYGNNKKYLEALIKMVY